MAGLHRRKFNDIIITKFKEHYKDRVSDESYDNALVELQKIIDKLEHSKKEIIKQRTESLKILKKLPLAKLKEMVGTDMV